MSREIDERIVAMYFDNKNFESGAQQTLKTLDELKKSCNMEGVGKGFEAFENVSKKLNLDDLRKKTDRVKSSFEGLGGVIKKTFNLATSPLRAFKGEIDQLNGYIGKVFGIDLASKIVGNLENAFRSLTVAPISAGWNQYENTMDSIKTIMSSTGEDIDTVKMKLGEMTTYANQTIYSLNDMTSNLGKFTNNGVKLDDATNAMIGLANATADAGQGAAQASMAMYNVSQAIGVGKMTTIDWKSLENANIATRRLKQTFIDAAVAHGTLEKKVEKDAKSGAEVVKYYTKAEKGSKAMEVSVENFRETLNKGWLDKTSMMNTFAIFSGQLTADEIAALGFSKEESARLYQIGQEAMAAATEVRTFKKMMDALRESVQSGWATSFEYIFGDMQEGTNLWTSINEKIDGILSKSTENRNNILMSWRGLMYDEDGQIRRIEEIYNNRKNALLDDYSHGRISGTVFNEKMLELEESIGDRSLWIDYREIAIDTFWDIFDVIQSVSGAVKGAFTDVFGEFNADTLKRLTQGFRDFVARVKNWLGDINNADSRLGKIRKGLVGIFNIVKLAINAFRTLFSIAWEMVKPLVDPLLNLFAKLGDWLQLDGAKNLGDMLKILRDRFKSLMASIKELGFSGVMAKIGEKLSSLWEKIKSGVRTFMYDNGLGGVYEWFSNIKEKFVSGYNAIKEWWEDPGNGIANFFKGIFEAVAGWFKTGVDEKGNEIRSPIAQFFYRIKFDIENAYNTVSKWWNDPNNGIVNFFKGIFESVTGWFKSGVDERGNETRSPIAQFFYRIKFDIENAFKTVSDWWVGGGIPKFFEDMWNSVVGLFEAKEITRYNGSMLETRYEDPPIVTFFKNIWSGIQSAYDSIVKWWEGSGIPEFFKNMWNSVVSWFQPVEITRYNGSMLETKYEDSPIVSFFKGLGTSLTNAWTTVSTLPIWNTIGTFFSDIWEKVTGAFQEQTAYRYNGSMLEEYTIDAPIVAWFKNLWKDMQNIWGQVSGWTGWQEIGNFISDTWNWITGKSEEKIPAGESDSSSPEEALAESERKVGIIQSIIDTLSNFWDSVKNWFADIGGGEIAQRFLTTLTKMLETMALIVEELVDFAHNVVTGNLDIQTIAEIIALIMGLKFMSKTRHDLAVITENATGIGETMLQMAGAIALISLAVAGLGQLKVEDLAKGIGVVIVIAFALNALTKRLTEMRSLGSGKEPQKAWERVVGKLITGLAMVGTMKILMDSLPTIIKAMSEAKKYSGLNGDDLMKTMIGVMTAVGGLMLALSIVNKIAPSGIDPVATGKTLISILELVGGFILGMFAAGGIMELLEGIVGDQAIKDVMQGAADLFEGLGNVFGSFFKGLFGLQTDGEKLDEGMANLETLSKFSEGFTLEKTAGITRILALITNLTKTAKDINTDQLTNFGTAAEELARGLLKFSWIVDGIDDLKGIGRAGDESYKALEEASDLIQKFFMAFEPLSGFASSGARYMFSNVMGDFIDFSTDLSKVREFVAGLNNVIDEMGGLKDGSNVNFNGIDIVRKLYDSIQVAFDNPSEDLLQFDATPIANAIVKALGVADPAITTAIHTMIQNGLNELGTENDTYDMSGVEGLTGMVETLSNLSSPLGNVANTMGINTEMLQKNINEMISGLNTEEWKLNSLDLPIDLNLLGDVDEDGTPELLSQIESQWTEIQSKIESGDYEAKLEIKVRPVLDTTDFDAQFASFSELFTGSMPVSMGAVIEIGNQPLPINDKSIVDEIRLLRIELQATTTALQSTMYSVDGNLANHIDGVAGAISNIKFPNAQPASLKDVDNGLYRSAKNSAMTGVSTYPNIRTKPVPMEE